jgi:hypothetical protein
MENKSNILNKIAMGGFLLFILLFVTLSSLVYFNNSSNVEIKIKTDNEVNKEKSAVNEALTQSLVAKNDSIVSYKLEVKKKDSVLYNKIELFEKQLKKTTREKDSLINILKRFKSSDIQPVNN